MNTQEIISAVSDAADPFTATEGDYTATEALALTSDYAQYPTDEAPQARVVPLDDPDASVLLVAAGGKVPKAVADALGLKAKKGIINADSAPAPPVAPSIVSPSVPQDDPPAAPPPAADPPAADPAPADPPV